MRSPSRAFATCGSWLRRLIIVGNDGMVSLAALRWLSDQDIAFVMLERDGRVLTTTGPASSSDARLRRAQSSADRSGANVKIARELIRQKLAAQGRVVGERLRKIGIAREIEGFRTALSTAETIDAVRVLEAKAAISYWSAWRSLPVLFPKNDLQRMPDHWQTVGTRESPVSGSRRRAANPANAILNYLYTLLESEARLAATALGLDPGLGFLHVDSRQRDSLANDLMEPIRPLVDEFVLDWIMHRPLKRDWFFEQRDGTCRLMSSLTAQLAETASTWQQAVAPVTEWVARTLWLTIAKSIQESPPETRLTQSRRREARGGPSTTPSVSPQPRPLNICRICGVDTGLGRAYCDSCVTIVSTDHLAEAAKIGRVAAQSPGAQAGRSQAQRRHQAGKRDWVPSMQPGWLTAEIYALKVQPLLTKLTSTVIATALGVSAPYAALVRAGKRQPHPRHWLGLAQLVGIRSPHETENLYLSQAPQ
jgi:CRISPR-associated endonuclease Cas1